MSAPVREADVDPTFIQRFENDVVVDRTVEKVSIGSWPDDPKSQRVWALSYVAMVENKALGRLWRSEDQEQGFADLFDMADKIIDYVESGLVDPS